jgi:hypothetical protein
MRDPLSPATRALLDAAKSDAPRMAARAQMWGAVSTATGVAAAAVKGGVAAGVTAAAAATASSGKLLVVGAFLGSMLTAGVGYGVVHVVTSSHHEVAAPPAPNPGNASAKVESTEHTKDGPGEVNAVATNGAADRAPARLTSGVAGDDKVPDKAQATSPTGGAPQAPSGAAAPRSARAGSDAALARELALVEEAKGAVRRGDPEGALALLDAARRLPSRQMELEELAIRSRALKKLGRDSEAEEVDVILRTKYPGNYLAR